MSTFEQLGSGIKLTEVGSEIDENILRHLVKQIHITDKSNDIAKVFNEKQITISTFLHSQPASMC